MTMTYGDSTVPPERSGIEGQPLSKRKFDVHSHSFQDTELKLHRYVNDLCATGCGEVDDTTLPQEGSGIKG